MTLRTRPTSVVATVIARLEFLFPQHAATTPHRHPASPPSSTLPTESFRNSPRHRLVRSFATSRRPCFLHSSSNDNRFSALCEHSPRHYACVGGSPSTQSQFRRQSSLITPQVEERLSSITENYSNIMDRLTDDAATLSTEDRTRLYKELSSLENAAEASQAYQKTQESLKDIKALLEDPSTDDDMRNLFKEEQKELLGSLPDIELAVVKALLPFDPHDEGNAILEIRAGIGGDEAGLFAADLMRMYERLSMQYNWSFQVMSLNTGVEGLNAVKEAIIKVSGTQVFGMLKYETGTHRVQRVPATDTHGRVHTSTATIVIMPQIQEHEVKINPADLKIDVFRAGGAGGQHVNSTESAVRITHLPTGITVNMQDERSQHKNKEKAMQIIVSRIIDADRTKRANERRDFRRKLIGTGDRSEKVRTYNYAQSRVTDHRIGFTVHNIDKFMAGDSVIEMINALRMQAEVEALATIQ